MPLDEQQELLLRERLQQSMDAGDEAGELEIREILAQPSATDRFALGGQAEPPKEDLERGGELAASGLARGAMFPAAGFAWGSPGMQALGPFLSQFGIAPGKGPVETVAGIGAQPSPDSPAERYLTAGAEGLGGAAMPGGMGKPILAALAGIGGGLGAEAGSQAGPVGSVAGGILGGSLAGLGGRASERFILGAPSSNLEELAQDSMAGVDKRALPAAGDAMRASKRAGLPLTLAQALPERSGLEAIQEALAMSKSGPRTRAALERQPISAQAMTDRVIEAVPGDVMDLQKAGNLAQDAAGDVLKQLRQERSERFKMILDKSGEVKIPEKALLSADQELATLAGKYPNTSLAETLTDLRASLRDQRGPAPGLNFLEKTDELNAVLRDQGSRLKAPNLKASSLDAEHQGVLRDAISRVRKAVFENNPDFRDAYADYAKFSDDFINPVQKGPTGRVAGKGATKVDEAMVSKVEGLMGKPISSKVPVGESDLEVFARDLPKDGSFAQVWKSILANKLERVPTVEAGRPAESFAKNIEGILIGSPAASETFLRGTRAAFESLGHSPRQAEKAATGVKQLVQIISASANRPKRIAGMSAPEIGERSQDSIVANAVRLWGFLPVERVAGSINRSVSERTMRAFDEIMTDPDKIPMLVKLAEEPVMSRKATVLAAAILGGGAAGTRANAQTSSRESGE